MKSSKLLFLLGLAITGTLSTPIIQTCNPVTTQTCRDILVPISATANNTLLPPFENSTNPSYIYEYIGSLNYSSIALFQNPVSGTFNMSMRYCESTVEVVNRQETIQLLLHGVAYTKDYWSGIQFPDPTFQSEYSWVSYAGSQGYATLAIDDLGNGDSSHPDPLNVVQQPLQVEIIRQIIQGLRNGSLPTISQHFTKVIFATHSYGALVGRRLATDHPTDGADAYILTASSNNLTGFNDAFATFQAKTANVVDHTRFGNLQSGYVAASALGIRDTVYSFDGDFDPKILAWDQKQPHVFAVREVATPTPDIPSNFTGPVFVLTGQYDQIVCGAGNISASVGNCGVGAGSNPDMTRVLFPKASRFDSYEPGHTGHDLNTHYSAPESFGAVHQWLENVGF